MAPAAVTETKSELRPEVKPVELEVKEVKEVKAAWRPALEGHLETFWASHAIEEVWETRVPTLTRVPKRLVGPLSCAFLSVLNHRLYNWRSDEAHAAEALFCKCVLRTLPPTGKGSRPVDVLRQRLDDWTDGRFEELWKAAKASRVSASRVAALVEDFHLSAAVKALNAEPPAKVNDESYKAMQERHPSASKPTVGRAEVPPHTVAFQRVLECIREFKTTSAGSMSGLRPAHLRFFLGAASHVDVLYRFTDVVNKLLTGSLPEKTQKYVGGANLTALLKKDGGLRPIACGDVWRRLTARCVCKNFAKDFLGALDPHQFGVAISGGTEILVHTARLLYEKAFEKPDFFLLKFDFRNAFNCISRQHFLDELEKKFPSLYPFVSQCYAEPSNLQFGERVLLSMCGVQQGDPLGPFLFCLAIHPILCKIKEACPNLVANSWYLDDGVVAGPEEEVVRALEIIEKEGPARGMFLNTAKSEVWSPAGIVPERLRHFKVLQPEGFDLLGSPVGSATYSQQFFAQKMKKFREVWASIQKLDHLQTQALLLRYCASFCKVVHLFRTVPPHLLTAELGEFDKEFRESMESITRQTSDFTWAFMGLGCKMGGLGLRPSKLHALGGYLASFSGASAWIKARFPAIPEADIQAREDFLTSAWSSAFGPLPQFAPQHDLSAITDSKLLPLLLESPARNLGRKHSNGHFIGLLEVSAIALEWDAHRQRLLSHLNQPSVQTGTTVSYSVPNARLPGKFGCVWRPRTVLQEGRGGNDSAQSANAAHRSGM